MTDNARDPAAAELQKALVLYNKGRGHDAEAICLQVLEQNPGNLNALTLLADIQRRQNRISDALRSYEKILAAAPDFAPALCNRGIALHDSGDYAAALESFDRAVASKPDMPEIWLNRANLLKDMGRPEDALKDYMKATALRPDYARAHLNEGLCRLMIGDFAGGWPKHEWRWRVNNKPVPEPKKIWLGREPLEGKTIFLHCEQGLGDTIQFCRYVEMVAAQGAQVVMGVQYGLIRLMEGLPGARKILQHGESVPPFDFHCPLMTLPLAFRTTMDTIPARTPYLRADPALVQKWKDRLGPKTGPRIGLAWRGRETNTRQHFRSLPLKHLVPLLGQSASFVTLQKDLLAHETVLLLSHKNVLPLGDELEDFADTAALIENLDLVITVDTSIAHMAGAQGKPVWIMLCQSADWRWFLERTDSPWYPTARLFRQPSFGDWDSVVADVGGTLADFLKG